MISAKNIDNSKYKEYDCDRKIENQRLRELWLRTNKQSSLLWKNVIKTIQLRQNNHESLIKCTKGYWKDEQEEALKSLIENGFYVLTKRLPPKIIIEINNRLSNRLVRPSNSSQQMLDLKAFAKDILESKDSKYIRWHFGDQTFEDIEILKT